MGLWQNLRTIPPTTRPRRLTDSELRRKPSRDTPLSLVLMPSTSETESSPSERTSPRSSRPNLLAPPSRKSAPPTNEEWNELRQSKVLERTARSSPAFGVSVKHILS